MAPIMKANHIIGYNSFKAGYPKLDSPNVQVKENKTRHEKYEVRSIPGCYCICYRLPMILNTS